MNIDRDPLRADYDGPEAVRELVRGVRHDNPDNAAMERMTKRLATACALSTPASEAKVRLRAGTNPTYYGLGLLGLVVAGGLAFTWRVTEAPSAPRAGEPATAPTTDSVVTQPATTWPDESRTLEGAEDRPTVPVDRLPSVAGPSRASASPPIGTGPATTAKASETASATELELFQRAKTALLSDPERALLLTSEQARAYPSGELVQEREVIAVEALSKLGRKEESWQRAVSLVRRFPRTPYAPRLEIAVGRPLSPASNNVEPPAQGDIGSSPSAPNP